MMEFLKKFRAVVFTAIALFLYLFGYRQAKETAEKEQLEGENNANKIAKKARDSLEGENNANKIAKKARDSLSDSERVKRLHNKYKR